MNEHNHHQFQSPGESAPLSLLPQLLARLDLDESPRGFDTSSESLEKAVLDPAWTVRITGIEALANFSDQQSLQWLFAALHDEDESVRACATRILGVRGDAAVSTVIEQLEATLHDPAWHVRETAIHALGMMQSVASLSALKAALDDEDPQVRLAAAHVNEHLESIASNERQENVIHGANGVAQLEGASPSVRPQRMRYPVASPVHPTHSENEREIPVIEEAQDMVDLHTSATDRIADTRRKRISTRTTRPRRPWLRVLEQVMAAILVLGIAISWFAISHLSHLSSGTPGVFNDTNARPLGAPTYTIRGNLSYLQQWSNDGHTFYSLQVDTKKRTLQVNALDAATGHTTVYPVLDSSWLTALGNSNIDIEGHYLLALRAQGSSLATLEIWDISGQHVITKQTVPASVGNTEQVLSPLLVASDNNQKFAMLSPDGTMTIWDLSNGQKLLTLEGRAPYTRGIPPEIKWYNHDQNLLFFGRSAQTSTFERWGPLEAWDMTSGKLLFNLHNTSKSYASPSISPNGKYLALSASSSNNSGSTLEILNAASGQVLRSYNLQALGLGGASFTWLSDNQHLLLLYTPDNTSHLHGQVLDVFTGQISGNFFSTYTGYGFEWLTPDARYLLQGSSDSSNSDNSSSMQIWQTSSGRLVATIATLGLHPNLYSYFGANNRYLLIGEKDTFDIWDVATGKLLFKYHGFTPFSVAGIGGSNVFWSPDGKYLTVVAWKASLMGTGSSDGVITIWRMP